MSWTALLPVKHPDHRKTRLSPALSAADRRRLSEQLFKQVTLVLSASREVGRIVTLSPMPVASLDWIEDDGRGLNLELAAALERLEGEQVFVVHSDLPLLQPADVAALLNTAQTYGAAIAPDLAGLGTNALAMVDWRGFGLAFGHDSCARHMRSAAEIGVELKPVTRLGLGLDIDLPADLERAAIYGFQVHAPIAASQS